MKKSKSLVVCFPVYRNYCIRIVFTDDLVAMRKKYSLDFPVRKGTEWEGLAVAGGKEDYIFFNTRFKLTPGVVAHEAYHAIRRMFEYIDADLLDNENMAYHLDYLVNKIWAYYA